MAWIELHTPLIRHRKVKKMARLLGIKPVQALGHLACFWSNVLELAEDGDITKWSPEDIAEYANYEGDSLLFYKTLQNKGVQLIDIRKGGGWEKCYMRIGRLNAAYLIGYPPRRLMRFILLP